MSATVFFKVRVHYGTRRELGVNAHAVSYSVKQLDRDCGREHILNQYSH